MLTRLKNENGSGLILALMTLMVLSVLGAALGAMTIGGYRLSNVNRDTTSAYYIAEAGVNQAYEEMRVLVNSAYNSHTTEEGFFSAVEATEYKDGKTITGFGNQFGDSPEAQVKLVQLEVQGKTRSYSLVSDGTVDNRNRTVEKTFDVTWVDKGGDVKFPLLPPDASLISKADISMSGGALISGDVHFDGLKEKSISLEGDAHIRDGNIYSHPSAAASKIISIPHYYNTNDYILQKRQMELPWDSYNTFLSSYRPAPTMSVHPSLSYSQLDDFKYKHTEWNSHMVVSNNNVNLNTWMLNTHDIQTENHTQINNIDVGQSSVLTIDTSHHLKMNNVTIGNNSTLNINTTAPSIVINNLVINSSAVNISTNNKDVTIYIENLELNNNQINFIGSGNVTIQVKNDIKINNGSFNTSGSGDFHIITRNYKHKNGAFTISDASQVELSIMNEFSFSNGTINSTTGSESKYMNVNYYGDSKISLGGSVFMLGNLFLDHSDLELTGSGNIEGLIISKGAQVDISGGSINKSIIFAPASETTITGGGQINGVLVTDKLSMVGGTKIIYNDKYLLKIPDQSVPDESSGNQELIVSHPVSEQK